MIPSKLRLAGFLSYQQPVEVDFDRLDLACISGSNGAGKSSLLDAITWVIFGQARNVSEAVINDRSEQAEVGLDFRYEGELYRIQRTKQRSKPAVLDFFIHHKDEGWKTLTEATLKKTEKLITDTLRMEYEVFTNASFFLQGKADSFATLKPGERKQILGSILGLEQWEEFKAKAGAHRKELENEVLVQQASLAEWERELSEEEPRKAELTRVENELKDREALLKSREEAVRLLRDLVKSQVEQRERLASQKDQVQALEQETAQLQATLQSRREEIARFDAIMGRADGIEKSFVELQELNRRLEKMQEQANQHARLESAAHAVRVAVERARAGLETELRSLGAQAEKIRGLSEKKHAAAAEKAAAESQIKELEARLSEKDDLQQQETSLVTEQSERAAQNAQWMSEMDKLKARIAQLESSESTCPLCGKPLSEADRRRHAAELNEEGKKMGDRFRENESRLKEIQKELGELRAKIAQISALSQNAQALQRRISALEEQLSGIEAGLKDWESTGARKLAEIKKDLADGRYEHEKQAELSRTEDLIRELGYSPDGHDRLKAEKAGYAKAEQDKHDLDQASAKIEALSREVEERAAQVEKKVGQLEAMRSDYQARQAALETARQSTPDLRAEEEQLEALHEERNRLQQELGAAKGRVSVLKDLKQQVKSGSEKLAGLRREIADTKQLENAFSANGIPALLVEEALPALENRANEILDRLSSGGMSVRFDTQKELKTKDEMRETLDIWITDAAGTRPYEMFSGGEAFRVNFAIRLALSHLLAQRAGARLRTLVIDEGFGSQDSDGRQRLIEAINQVKGDFEKILVITHLEEFKDAFPAKIEVEKTLQGSVVKVVTS